MRIEGKLKKGYEIDSFKDSFGRYIPSAQPASSVTTEQPNDNNELSQNQSVTANNGVTDLKQLNLLKSHECYGVTVENSVPEEDKPKWKQLRFESEEDYLEMISN